MKIELIYKGEETSCGAYALSSRKCVIQIRISDLFLGTSLLLSKSAAQRPIETAGRIG